MRWLSEGRAEIPYELRREFEQFGETVVALLISNPWAGSGAESPKWKQDSEKG